MNDYGADGIIGKGPYGTVDKGRLGDNTMICIKEYNMGGKYKSFQALSNKIALLSQMNHKNVVRLLGGCVEGKTPLLVYEFIHNGTLYDHIQRSLLQRSGRPPLSFKLRLK
ncbi:putative wall-associated receptor kinase-like 16 [Pyrus x bretschneideri]|uniref:putative wall-associated receptor kinase-like 16 n=1 Tax=Pyrus x bretschneideri TaxID=225117 RepID=UPI002030D884|nr:putative wall-associated receptor kinase-like 16 [Pyrus x bretschneideri]